ncbi:hypothetical protein NI389_13085 [Pseudoalteromonas xiamenensis]|uniref:hypothetical protein n=1 Tax=Pseudoalteromonas xiamenensis TaxID=882626 RepID=UPI0027E5B7DF|nr:hypothetical protein [Pseudoalteromonas xiamenensis]WMN59141.1 hypothetical protein NI389_13085 [Pseudoalteromonas xiamenensis]
MKKTLLALCALGMTNLTFADVANEYGETQSLLVNEDVKTLHIVDINADNRKDLVWVTSDGSVKYKLRNNDAKATLDTLPGTRWRLEYANDKGLKFIDFTQNGGVITVNGRYFFKITELMMTENGELSFCTSKSEGLNRTDCGWNYRVTDILPNMMKGTDDDTGWDWVAYRLVQ